MNQRPKLAQAIGRLGFFSLAFGSMIGVGWITGLKSLFEQAGPVGTTLAFVLGAGLMIVIGMCYAEAMKLLPVTGGEVAYAYKAYGTDKAFVIGWCLAIGYLSVSAFEAVSVGIVLSYLIQVDAWPLYEFNGSTVYGSHLLLAFVFTAFITGINLRGVGIATTIQTGLTGLLILFAAAFVIAGFSQGDVANLTPAFGPTESWTAMGGMLAVFVTVPFWYVGFDTIPQAAEERAEGFPAHALGRMLVLAIVGSTVFYGLVFMSVGMATKWSSVIDMPLPTAAAFEAAFGSSFWARVVLTVGLIGLLTSWNGFFLSASRVLFALGRGHILHPAFGRTHPKYGTPTTAIWFSAAFTFIGAFLGKAAVLILVNVGSMCITIAFLGVASSLRKIRKDTQVTTFGYQHVLPIAAALGSLFILGAMLIPGSPAMLPWPTEWIVLVVVAVIGYILWKTAAPIRDALPDADRSELILDEPSDSG
ncbi:MAG: APC family permease [Planctomycetota bacterium]